MTRWYEDIALNEEYPLGSHTFRADEIVAFATKFDPQYFHLDEEAAKHSHFGGLVASGWHTAAIGHRRMVDTLAAEADRLRDRGETPGVSGPSPGINRISFPTPVRPGDSISYTLTVTAKRASNSLPGWGVLFNRIDGVNQHGQTVYSADIVAFSKLRD